MKHIDIKSALIGALLAITLTLSVAAAAANRTVWEYKVITGKGFLNELEKAINASVVEGWDFVSASGPNNENWGIAVLRREKK
jgi:hypothetical protein